MMSGNDTQALYLEALQNETESSTLRPRRVR
jgi:hypothetical protein